MTDTIKAEANAQKDTRQKLAEAIISLIEDPDRARQNGRKARKKIVENFTEKKMIQKTEAVYYEISFT